MRRDIRIEGEVQKVLPILYKPQTAGMNLRKGKKKNMRFGVINLATTEVMLNSAM
jgi:hypothetical protein